MTVPLREDCRESEEIVKRLISLEENREIWNKKVQIVNYKAKRLF